MNQTWVTRLFKWGGVFVGVWLLLLFAVAFDGVPVQIVMRLVGGGFLHAAASCPYMVPSYSTLVTFVILVVVSVCALQILLAKFAQPKQQSGFRWRLKWTFAVVGLVLTAIGTACSTVGLAHHGPWLVREGLASFVPSHGPIHKSIGNCRVLITALRIYSSEHGGEYPKELEDLVREGVMDQEDFVRRNVMIGRDGLPTPWVLLPGLTDASPGDLPLIIGSCPVGNDLYIVGTNDSSVALAKREDFEEIMTRYRECRGIEHDGKAAPESQQNRELTPPATVP